jgi:hypothetical protein
VGDGDGVADWVGVGVMVAVGTLVSVGVIVGVAVAYVSQAITASVQPEPGNLAEIVALGCA